MIDIKFRQRNLNNGSYYYWGLVDGIWQNPKIQDNYIHPMDSQQYICMKDKNGVEIYEDDIIQTVLDDGSRFSKFIVKWNVNTASFRMIRYQDDSGFKIDTIVLQNKEVIGNIHEQEPHT